MHNTHAEEISLDELVGLNIARQESEGDRRVKEREITTHYVGNLRHKRRERGYLEIYKQRERE